MGVLYHWISLQQATYKMPRNILISIRIFQRAHLDQAIVAHACH